MDSKAAEVFIGEKVTNIQRKYGGDELFLSAGDEQWRLLIQHVAGIF